MRHLFMLSIAAILCGCAGAAKIEENRMDNAIKRYGPACEKLGYQAETDGWRECVLRLRSQP